MKTVLIQTLWVTIDGELKDTFDVVQASDERQLKFLIKLSVLKNMQKDGKLALPVMTEVMPQAVMKADKLPDECQVFLPA